MAERKLTSTVVLKVSDWADESYLIPHEPLRWDLLESQRLLDEKYFDGTVQWKVDAFYKWYDTFTEIVHHHHDTEEKVFFPLLKARAEVPDRMSKDHIGLLKMMTEIKESKKNFDKASSKEEKRKAGVTLRTLWNAFAKEMIEHLAEEERVIIPLIRKHMTSKEHDALIDTILQGLGLSGNALMLPWILRSMKVWKGQKGVDEFTKVIPAPIRLLNNWFWTPAYEANNWGLLHSLEGNQPPKSSSSGMITAVVVIAGAVSVGAFLYAGHGALQ
jgi:hemerythrin superfamily protein